ncbi:MULTISPECIES: hypothetical protein [Pseudobutyrivibrio]|jgi:hypothetical protein|uniref:Uncharacterized protein n=2 Tax=Pseudobutyrivibrio TaxID=46205 RepID=A0A2G3DZU7_9FIRM|nr:MULTISPECIES: hypothetical protein [Pseudobutyrivibrio]MBE5904945.1 hypothetical protein [Pseudobutyrivibrio sp.]MBP5326175.1 hypothetical protein [Pseudobutyrivibrio sp.]MBQ7468922.1 hypothetical protein [Pseudobutyrivibrio sp.]MBR5951815.1 hypothetical protein [Pseudobutyrivibrio sp.]NEX00305.1 hypothetical protein [Pseudobutyrivibrio xylanivorans]
MSNFEEEQVNPILLEFLDTDDFEEKYKILVATPIMDFDNLLIDNMASSIDCVIEDGDIESRVQELKVCVKTRAKYETLRLRR